MESYGMHTSKTQLFYLVNVFEIHVFTVSICGLLNISAGIILHSVAVPKCGCPFTSYEHQWSCQFGVNMNKSATTIYIYDCIN